MNSRLPTFLCIAALVASPHVGAKERSPAEVFRIAAPSIVIVETYDKTGALIGQGSGVVTEREIVTTNCHVLKGAVVVRVRNSSNEYSAELRHVDDQRDLCSLHAAKLSAPAIQMGTSNLSVGDRAYAIGAPRGFDLTLSEGLLSSLRKVSGGNILQVTTPISPGSSGGGLFDSNARLIGITTLYFEGSQQLNFAVPVEWIAQLPKRHKRVEAGYGVGRSAAEGADALAADEAAMAADSAAADAAAAANAAAAAAANAGPPTDAAQAAADTAFAAADAAAADAAQAAADAANAASTVGDGPSVLNQYALAMQAAIHAKWQPSLFVRAGSECILLIHQVPGGKVDGVDVDSTCPFGARDKASLKAAVLAAQPLPYVGYESVFTPNLSLVFVSGISPRQVEGQVYSYMSNGRRHYSSKVPPAGVGATEARTIKYTFWEAAPVQTTSKWQLVQQDDEGQVHFDTSTLKLAGNDLHVWVRYTKYKPVSLAGYKGVTKVLSSEVFYCSDRQVTAKTLILYSNAGSVLATLPGSETGARNHVVPDTVGEVVFTAACG